MSFGCERSYPSHQRVSYFNSKVPQAGIYPHIKFEKRSHLGLRADAVAAMLKT